MTRTFNDACEGHREVYTPPYDLAGLAQIVSNNTDRYDRWSIYVTIGCPGNYIFGPYLITINTSNGMWSIQSAETVYDLRVGNGYTEERGELLNCNVDSICEVLRKVGYR